LIGGFEAKTARNPHYSFTQFQEVGVKLPGRYSKYSDDTMKRQEGAALLVFLMILLGSSSLLLIKMLTGMHAQEEQRRITTRPCWGRRGMP